MRIKLFSVVFFLFFITACNLLQRKDELPKDVIAKAYNYYLYKDDLKGIVPSTSSKNDSATIVKNFIDNWIRQKAVLHKAENNLDDEKKNVDKQLEEYRNSLITYAYEHELIRQKLDTNVSENEIAAFYDQNKNNFELKDNIIKVIYLKLGKKSPKLNKVKEWYQSDAVKDRQQLEEYCRQYALNYYLDDNTWLLFDDLLKEIPIKTYDKEQFLRNNRTIEIEDSSMIYLVNIKGFMIKNSTSPLSFEKPNIRSMIINERKLKLIEDMEKGIYDQAQRSGEIQVF